MHTAAFPICTILHNITTSYYHSSRRSAHLLPSVCCTVDSAPPLIVPVSRWPVELRALSLLSRALPVDRKSSWISYYIFLGMLMDGKTSWLLYYILKPDKYQIIPIYNRPQWSLQWHHDPNHLLPTYAPVSAWNMAAHSGHFSGTTIQTIYYLPMLQ